MPKSPIVSLRLHPCTVEWLARAAEALNLPPHVVHRLIIDKVARETGERFADLALNPDQDAIKYGPGTDG